MPSPAHTAAPVIWIYGLPSAGKTTLARALHELLSARGVACYVLDGDELRTGLCRGLGFSMEDRAENLRRAAEVAKIISRTGTTVIAAFVTPLASHRQILRDILDPDQLRLVFLNCSQDVCMQRDAKGLYKRAAEGKVTLMTGVGSAFEAPAAAEEDLVLLPDAAPPEVLAQRVLGGCASKPPLENRE